MGRYIGVPDSLVAEIENIVPIASRYNNRTVYTTPGSYTFTVPAGVTQITAVAVGPGGKPCTIIECMVTCGKLQCISGFIAVCKWYYTDATCPAHCRPACSPLDGTCVCTFDTCRTYCWTKCVLPMILCRCANMAANQCDFHSIELSSFDQSMKLVHLPTGAGGGYAEKTAATTAGSQYSIVVGQDCDGTSPNAFSCVNGLNISICATGPKSYSDSANTDVLGSNDRYFFDSVTSTWKCLSPKNVFNVRTVTSSTVASPARCIGCICICGSRSAPCYCIVTTWNSCVAAGQGFGGDINRTGGFCCTCMTLALSQIPNTTCYPYAQKIKDCKFGPYLCGTVRCCFMGCSGIVDACLLECIYCMGARGAVAPVVNCCSDCNCVGTAFFYYCIVGNDAGASTAYFYDHLSIRDNTGYNCPSASRIEYHYVCGSFSQHLREVGDSALCVTNFDVYAPGTHNPYCAITQNVNLLTLGQNCYGTCLSVNCFHVMFNCSYYAGGGTAYCCAETDHSISIDWGNASSRSVWNPSCVYRCMNCDLNAGANAFARYKFGGSSAGNYYRNGVSALTDDNTYTVNCSSGFFGHCSSSPYSCPCNYNRANAFASNSVSAVYISRCLNVTSSFNNFFMYGISQFCSAGGVLAAGGGNSLDCCCMFGHLGYFAAKYLGNECAFKAYCTMPGLCRTMNDTLRLNLPQGITQCSQFTNDEQHAWTGFHNWYSSLMFAATRMCVNVLGTGVGNCTFGNTATDGYFICLYHGSQGVYGYAACACAPAPRTCLKYFSIISPGSTTRLDCCGNSGTGTTSASYFGGPNVLLCVVPIDGSIGGGTISRCSFVCHMAYGHECFQSCYHCRVIGTHCYWPNAVNYNFCTTSCRVINLNPLINLYDYICSSYVGCAGCCAETCAGINTHYDHESVFESVMPFDASETLTAFYYPDTAVVGTRCCVYKSSDKVTISDRHYLAQYTASMNWCTCLILYACRSQSLTSGSQAYCRRLIAMLAGVCANYAKCSGARCCDLSTNVNYAQGGAGIGTAGIWGEGVITCTLISSGGGNIKCLLPCCNVQYCWSDAAVGTGICTISKTMGWGLTPGTATFKIVDTTGSGTGASIVANFAGLNCFCGTGFAVNVPTVGVVSTAVPYSGTICYGFGYVSDFSLTNCGFNYSSANGAVVMCTDMDRCTYCWGCTRNYACSIYGCFVALCCGCWVPTAGSNRCPDFTPAGPNSPTYGLTTIPGPIIIPHFCVFVQPSYANYSCIATTYSEGSGGGSKTGQTYCSKYATIIDSPTIVSIIPGRGGRGNESPYEPYYYSYPGISARLSTPRPPGNYVGDTTTGCSWFDTPQINGSGGNGMFCSANFSCIFVQCPGPGGGGANGTRADGTICANGGVLGGGAGCCGCGGNGGGSGWGVTANNVGMVVMYWNA